MKREKTLGYVHRTGLQLLGGSTDPCGVRGSVNSSSTRRLRLERAAPAGLSLFLLQPPDNKNVFIKRLQIQLNS